jgi:hypothetical protein
MARQIQLGIRLGVPGTAKIAGNFANGARLSVKR